MEKLGDYMVRENGTRMMINVRGYYQGGSGVHVLKVEAMSVRG